MKTKMAKEMLRIVQTRLDNRGVLKPIEYKTLEICCGILNGYAIVEKCDELVRQGENDDWRDKEDEEWQTKEKVTMLLQE